MSIFLQAGVELDHPDQGKEFNVLSLSAVPKGCPTFDRFGLAEYNEFNKHFLGWLCELERIKLGLSEPTDSVVVPPKASFPSDLDGLIEMEDEEPKSTKRKRGKSKGGVKGKGKGAVKPKLKEKKKGSSSKKAAAHDQETAESDFSLEFEDDSGGEALVAGVGMDDEEAAVEGVGR
ncbi:hypothetical protein V5O48_019233, partial [Marasmius crinis-equi]